MHHLRYFQNQPRLHKSISQVHSYEKNHSNLWPRDDIGSVTLSSDDGSIIKIDISLSRID